MAQLARTQWRAIAFARWRLVINGLRSTRGTVELVARIWAGLMFAMMGLAGMTGCGVATWYFLSHGHGERIAFLLWALLAFWQIFPIATSAFSEQVDTSNLLRFPLSYPAYFGVRLAYGSLDAATLVCSLSLLGMTLGAGVASAALLPWAALVFLTFALFNVLLAQMIFAWIERWLARRRSREILGALFFLLIVSFQLIGPLSRRFSHHTLPSGTLQELRRAWNIQRWLPPGLAAHAVAGRWASAAGAFALLLGCAAIVLALLHQRLSAEFHGENLSESAPAARRAAGPARPALEWGGGPAVAVMQKELRYLRRSPALYFMLAMPVVILVVISLNQGGGRPGHAGFHAGGFGFPIGMAYAVMMLTNLIANTFGTDHGGIQFYYVAPVRWSEIVAGKNLAVAALIAAEAVVIAVVATVLQGPPREGLAALTVAATVLAVLINLCVGNFLSFYMPRKMDLSRMGRQGGKTASGMIALAAQLGAFLVIAAAVAIGWFSGHLYPVATAITAAAAFGAAIAYRVGLAQTGRLAMKYQQTLITELCKA